MRKSEDENREEKGWCRERDGEQQREQKEVNSLAGEGRQNMATEKNGGGIPSLLQKG
jgi:hypothetical protein